MAESEVHEAGNAAIDALVAENVALLQQLEEAGWRIKELETTYGAKWLQDHQYLDWLCESNKANAVLSQRLEAAEKALKKYGEHKHNCTARDGWKCNCGLDAALAGKEKIK